MNKKWISKTMVATMALAMGLQFSATNAEALMLHKVQKGENLFKISQKYGMTVENIMNNNDLSSDKLHAGQTLKIHNAVKVKKGDTLYSVSKNEGVTVSELKKLNGLKSNTIKPGQVLKLHDVKDGPHVIIDKDGNLAVIGYGVMGWEVNDTRFPPQVIIVSSGDTLCGLAKDFNTTVSKIKSLNQLTSDKIKIGQKLKIRSDKEQKALEAKITADYRKEMADLKKNKPDEYKAWVQELKEWKKADPKGFNEFLKEMPLYAPVIKEIMK